MNPRRISPIIKVTENCNFRCDYCHFARNLRKHEHHPHTMELDLLRHILAQCADYNLSHDIRDMDICYHGGEPLLCGIDYFQKVVEIEKDISKSFQGITITHSLQTNGFLINDDWCDLFEKGQFNVGVSIDGDFSHNHHFGPAGPKKSTDAVLQNIQRLHQKSISHGILFVVSNNHEGYGKNFYDFCIQNKITKIGFCRCFNEENSTTVENKILSSFLIIFL